MPKGVRKSPRKPPRISPRIMEAIGLYMQGKTSAEIAKHFSVTPSAVNQWLARDDVQEQCRQMVRDKIAPLVDAALEVLRAEISMERTPATAWTRINAANMLLGKYGSAITDAPAPQLVIQIVGAPTLGSPQQDAITAGDSSQADSVPAGPGSSVM